MIDALPSPEPSPSAIDKKEATFDEFLIESQSHKGFINPALAAILLGRHRSRIYQLIRKGTFKLYHCYGFPLLSASEVATWHWSQRKRGRPKKKQTERQPAARSA